MWALRVIPPDGKRGPSLLRFLTFASTGAVYTKSGLRELGSRATGSLQSRALAKGRERLECSFAFGRTRMRIHAHE
jgi:hypothetical protein